MRKVSEVIKSKSCPVARWSRMAPWCRILMLFAAGVPLVGRAEAPAFPGATALYKAWVAARLPGNPEGLAIDRDGNMYAGLWQSGALVKLDGKGGYRTVAVIPSEALGREGITTGLEFGADGALYAAFMWHYTPEEELDPKHPACRNAQDVYTGIYRVDVNTGAVAPFLTKRTGWPGCFPDDIAVDSNGNLYVTDLTLSGIWKITPAGKYSLWCSDVLLQWPPAPYSSFPEGANDLVISNDGTALYVVTDGNPAIVKVPIQKDGSAGTASLISRDLTMLDGIEKDERGNIYVSEPYRNEISVFSADGTQRIVIATADTAPIVNPTSLVYRKGILCVANSGMGPTAITEPRTVTCLSGFKRPEGEPR
jgi:sugar lactone lactonase YvrE